MTPWSSFLISETQNYRLATTTTNNNNDNNNSNNNIDIMIILPDSLYEFLLTVSKEESCGMCGIFSRWTIFSNRFNGWIY